MPNPGPGIMVHVARRLFDRVQVGEVFNPAEVLADLPGTPDARERRMRDLSRLGWVVHSSREDATIPAGCRRLVKVGTHVWEPGTSRGVGTRRVKVAAVDLAVFDAGRLRAIWDWMSVGLRLPSAEEQQLWKDFAAADPDGRKALRAQVAEALMDMGGGR